MRGYVSSQEGKWISRKNKSHWEEKLTSDTNLHQPLFPQNKNPKHFDRFLIPEFLYLKKKWKKKTCSTYRSDPYNHRMSWHRPGTSPGICSIQLLLHAESLNRFLNAWRGKQFRIHCLLREKNIKTTISNIHIIYIYMYIYIYIQRDIEISRNISNTHPIDQLTTTLHPCHLNVHLAATCHKLPDFLAGQNPASIGSKKSTIGSVLDLRVIDSKFKLFYWNLEFEVMAFLLK